jgi:hypothetical protein
MSERGIGTCVDRKMGLDTAAFGPLPPKRERSEKWNGSPSGNVSVKTEFGPKVARPTDGPSE